MSAERCAVVVIALHGGTSLEACLRVLATQDARCTVMLGAAMGTVSEWTLRFPAARFIEAATMSVPHKRMRGIAATRAECIALLEDSSIPGRAWWSAVEEVCSLADVAAAAGPVTIADHISFRQKALGCCEFGRYHPAWLDRLAQRTKRDHSGSFELDRLPGNNIAYRSAALRAIAAADGALIETSVNAKLRAAGARLLLHPAMEVQYRPCNNYGTRLIDRFRHGRLYGGNHVACRSRAFRAWCLCKACVLPLVLSGRSLRWMTKAVHPSAWWCVGFFICCMEAAWAAGEAIGYLAGPGRTLETWH